MNQELRKIKKYLTKIENQNISISLINEITALKKITTDIMLKTKLDEFLKKSFITYFDTKHQENHTC